MTYISSIRLHKISRLAFWGTFLVSLVLLLSGCKGGAEETISPDQARTSVAQTVTAAIAETQAVLPTNTPSPTFMLTATENPTATPVSASPTPTAQDAAPPSVPQVPQPASCDNAIFVSDVTIPDGTDLEPGSVFTKTWRLQNTGTCTWDSAYSFVYTSGDLMDASSSTSLVDEAVDPGESVDISVDMVAPSTAGSYTGYWQMQNASGVLFGDGVYVQIDVLDSLALTDTPTATGEMTETPIATETLGPSDTPLPSSTPGQVDTSTPESTNTIFPSDTPIPTETIIPSDTPVPTDTPSP